MNVKVATLFLKRMFWVESKTPFEIRLQKHPGRVAIVVVTWTLTAASSFGLNTIKFHFQINVRIIFLLFSDNSNDERRVIPQRISVNVHVQVLINRLCLFGLVENDFEIIGNYRRN